MNLPSLPSFLLPVILLTWIALSFSCSPAAPARTWTGTMTDSAGVVIVGNPESGMWTEGEGWTLEEELRIGTLGGDVNYQFGQVGTIAVGPEGEIYVSDAQAQEVRVFSSDGGYLRSIGSPGSGPGELGLGASDVLLTADGVLLVPDRRNRRISRFSADGAPLRSEPLYPERERLLRFNQNGVGQVATQVRPVYPPSEIPVEGSDAIVVVEPLGVFGDTLLQVPTGGLFRGPGIHYFTPEPMWNITDSLTVVFGMNSEFRIGFYDTGGSLRRIVTKQVPPNPITDRDIRAIFDFLDRAWLDAGVPPSQLEENRQAVHFAEFFPAFSVLHIGHEGSLWVQRVQSPGELSEERMERYNFTEDFGAPEWDVFDDQGRYFGVVMMPDRFQPRLFREDKIYGVQRDELDVQYVIRFRVGR